MRATAEKQPQVRPQDPLPHRLPTPTSGSLSELHPLSSIPRTLGSQAALQLSTPADLQEQEADRAAEAVMRKTNAEMEQPAGNRQLPEGSKDVEFKNLPGGQPLAASERAFFEPRFGHDFSRVRIHVGESAAASAHMLRARAYTVGPNIVFGKGRYVPSTTEGRHLLAHELSHVVQQRTANQPALQRSPLADFNDSDPKHDPSFLTDAQIMATDEFKVLSTKVFPPSKAPAPQAEVLLACRLMLRRMREVSMQIVTLMSDAASFLDQAHKQLGTLTETTKQVGNLNWVPFNTSAAVNMPSALPTEFGRWILAGGPMPDKMSGSVNCWEMVLFGAFKAGFITFARIKQIYDLAVANVKSGKASLVGDTVETELRGGDVHTFDPSKADSPSPLPGDLVIFNKAANHVAISTGTVKGGKHEVISLWSQPNNISHVQRTTIEDLLAVTGSGGQPVKFWTVKW